jgi:hypothetical protein
VVQAHGRESWEHFKIMHGEFGKLIPKAIEHALKFKDR